MSRRIAPRWEYEEMRKRIAIDWQPLEADEAVYVFDNERAKRPPPVKHIEVQPHRQRKPPPAD